MDDRKRRVNNIKARLGVRKLHDYNDYSHTTMNYEKEELRQFWACFCSDETSRQKAHAGALHAWSHSEKLPPPSEK